MQEMQEVPLSEWVPVRCPHCGEIVDLDIAADLRGELVQDCEVCCRPWRLRIERDEWGDPVVEIEQS